MKKTGLRYCCASRMFFENVEMQPEGRERKRGEGDSRDLRRIGDRAGDVPDHAEQEGERGVPIDAISA